MINQQSPWSSIVASNIARTKPSSTSTTSPLAATATTTVTPAASTNNIIANNNIISNNNTTTNKSTKISTAPLLASSSRDFLLSHADNVQATASTSTILDQPISPINCNNKTASQHDDGTSIWGSCVERTGIEWGSRQKPTEALNNKPRNNNDQSMIAKQLQQQQQPQQQPILNETVAKPSLSNAFFRGNVFKEEHHRILISFGFKHDEIVATLAAGESFCASDPTKQAIFNCSPMMSIYKLLRLQAKHDKLAVEYLSNMIRNMNVDPKDYSQVSDIKRAIEQYALRKEKLQACVEMIEINSLLEPEMDEFNLPFNALNINDTGDDFNNSKAKDEMRTIGSWDQTQEGAISSQKTTGTAHLDDGTAIWGASVAAKTGIDWAEKEKKSEPVATKIDKKPISNTTTSIDGTEAWISAQKSTETKQAAPIVKPSSEGWLKQSSSLAQPSNSPWGEIGSKPASNSIQSSWLIQQQPSSNQSENGSLFDDNLYKFNLKNEISANSPDSFLNLASHETGLRQMPVSLNHDSAFDASSINPASQILPDGMVISDSLKQMVNQIQLAVQAGHLNALILDKPMSATTLQLVYQLLTQIKNLKKLQEIQQRSHLMDLDSKALSAINMQINRTNKNIAIIQKSLAVQQQLNPSPATNSSTDNLKFSNGNKSPNFPQQQQYLPSLFGRKVDGNSSIGSSSMHSSKSDNGACFNIDNGWLSKDIIGDGRPEVAQSQSIYSAAALAAAAANKQTSQSSATSLLDKLSNELIDHATSSSSSSSLMSRVQAPWSTAAGPSAESSPLSWLDKSGTSSASVSQLRQQQQQNHNNHAKDSILSLRSSDCVEAPKSSWSFLGPSPIFSSSPSSSFNMNNGLTSLDSNIDRSKPLASQSNSSASIDLKKNFKLASELGPSASSSTLLAAGGDCNGLSAWMSPLLANSNSDISISSQGNMKNSAALEALHHHNSHHHHQQQQHSLLNSLASLESLGATSSGANSGAVGGRPAPPPGLLAGGFNGLQL